MSEIHFVVENAEEGGFIARAIGQDIFTEANTEAELQQQVRDAVRCHFDEDKPGLIRLHFSREVLLTV